MALVAPIHHQLGVDSVMQVSSDKLRANSYHFVASEYGNKMEAGVFIHLLLCISLCCADTLNILAGVIRCPSHCDHLASVTLLDGEDLAPDLDAGRLRF